MKRICKWFFVIFMIIGAVNLPAKSFAQGIPCDYDDPLNPCPIDGGVGVLLALGVGYGIKKYRSVAKNSKVDHT